MAWAKPRPVSFRCALCHHYTRLEEVAKMPDRVAACTTGETYLCKPCASDEKTLKIVEAMVENAYATGARVERMKVKRFLREYLPEPPTSMRDVVF